jgi:hypothetical protein
MSGIARSRLAEERKGELNGYMPACTSSPVHCVTPCYSFRPLLHTRPLFLSLPSHSYPPLSLHALFFAAPPTAVWRKDRPHGFFARPEMLDRYGHTQHKPLARHPAPPPCV